MKHPVLNVMEVLRKTCVTKDLFFCIKVIWIVQAVA